jgi:hypothetical protein
VGRRARLVELDPKCVDVIVQRWQSLTGGSATHAAIGQKFADSKAEGLSRDSIDTASDLDLVGLDLEFEQFLERARNGAAS